MERISILDFVGAASSRDRFNSRLEATRLSSSKSAPADVFFSYLDLPDKRINELRFDWKRRFLQCSAWRKALLKKSNLLYQ